MMGLLACMFESLCLKTEETFLPRSNLFLNCVLSRARHNPKMKDQF